ncbi:MAG: SH3-like domain-containing protein [Lewinellaceae bacterium]|nr:SH3-like domain-containing protein [Lewinellaceae bacterium]
MQKIKISAMLLCALAFAACDSQPKVIEAETSGDQSSTPIFQDAPAATVAAGGQQDMAGSEHKVVVAEALNTDKYSYLRVKENGEEKWIAISKRDVKIGGNYLYTGGLMKKNFQSKEFNRVFETVYLVSDFREEGAGAAGAAQGGMPPAAGALEPPKNLKPAPGAIKISDLVANIRKYDGKVVKVTGKCVKVNPMIMGRNWLHIQDGSGKNIDLTVTTTENIPLGAIITLEGTIAVDKDFGAGYRYAYIMEGAVSK